MNYYWPDLHREVSKRTPAGVRKLSEHELTKFGRDLFEETDQASLKKLRDLGIHHCFLALILEQAGIGKNRNRIIHDFLRWLVAARVSLRIGENADWSADAVRCYARSQPEAGRHDITLLGNVLARIGSELIALVTAIESRPDRVEIMGWSWSQLRAWWLNEAGSDLDALTPSAATILLAWISKLSSVWKRSDIFRLSRVGRIACRWPDGSSVSSFGSYIELPLGVARLRFEDTFQDVVIVDTDGLDLATILKLDRDTWLSIDDTYRCRTSDRPFVEDHPEYGAVCSVPVFAKFQSRTPQIYYWGHRSKEYRPASAATLRVQAQFKWRYDKLFVVLGGIRTSVEDGGEFLLRIGSQEIWAGDVSNGYLSGWTSRLFSVDRFLAADETELKMILLRDDAVVAQRMIPVCPLQEEAFLACGTTVCTASRSIVRWIEPGSEVWRTTLLVKAPVTELMLSGISEISRADVRIHGAPYVAMKLKPAIGEQASVQVRRQQWKLLYKLLPSFLYPTDLEVTRCEVSFAGAGNIRVVDRVEDAILSCEVPISDTEVGVWIVSGEIECFCKLEEGTSEINIGELAQRNGLTIQPGEIKARIGTSLSQGNIAFNFYLPTQEPSIESSQLGTPSRINLSPKLLPSCRLSSQPISLADVVESKFCSSTIRGDRLEVTVRWKPDIVDVMVGGKIGKGCGYQYKILADESSPTKVLCQPILSRRGCATIQFLGSETKVEAGQAYDLLPLIRSAMGSESIAVSPMTVRCKDDQIEWEIDVSPSVRNLVAEVSSEVNGHLQVDVSFEVFSLFPVELKLSIGAGGKYYSSRHFWTTAEFGERFSYSLHASRAVEALDSLEVQVTRGHDPVHVSTVCIAPATSGLTTEEKLKQLIMAYRQTRSTDYLAEILLTYIYNHEEACRAFAPSSIARKVGIGANPESETSLDLSLRMLAELSSGAKAYQALPSSRAVDPTLSALASSIWLLLSKRFAAAGLLNPTEFSMATSNANVAHSSIDERVRSFAVLAYNFARHVERAEKISTNIRWLNIATTDSAGDLDESIGRLSTDVETWLEIDR